MTFRARLLISSMHTMSFSESSIVDSLGLLGPAPPTTSLSIMGLSRLLKKGPFVIVIPSARVPFPNLMGSLRISEFRIVARNVEDAVVDFRQEVLGVDVLDSLVGLERVL